LSLIRYNFGLAGAVAHLLFPFEGNSMADLDANAPSDTLYRIRHSLAPVLAQAVKQEFPNAKLGFGPPPDHGFYYDCVFGDDVLAANSLMKL